MTGTILSSGIDWITASKVGAWGGLDKPENISDALWVALRVKQELGLDAGTLVFERRSAFYPWEFTAPEYGVTIAISADLIEQGVKVICPGQSFKKGVHAETLLAIMADRSWRCTRLDVCFDVVGVPLDWENLEYKCKAAFVPLRRSIGSHISSTGNTITIGSRSSERYVRIYDKGRQQKVDYPWTRVEMEYKGDIAFGMARQGRPVTRRGLSDMTAWLKPLEHDIWYQLNDYLETAPVKMVAQKDTKSDREVWMNTVVTSALRKWHGDDPGSPRQWLNNMSRLLDILDGLD